MKTMYEFLTVPRVFIYFEYFSLYNALFLITSKTILLNVDEVMKPRRQRDMENS